MNNWLNKLERKYGRFGIPNLTNILVAGQSSGNSCLPPARRTLPMRPS